MSRIPTMMAGPATFLITLIMLAAIGAGVLIIVRARGTRSGDRRRSGDVTQSACPNCKLLNPTHATFCGHCGKPLH